MPKANRNRSIFSNMLWSFAEKISAQLVSFIVSVVLARILLPDDYGLISMVLVFVTLAEVFVNSGFSAALIQNKDAEDADFSTIFYMSFICSFVIYGLVFLLAYPISGFYGRPELTLLLQVFALKIPIGSFNSIQRAYVSRHMLFRKFFYSTLTGTIGSGAVGIALAMSGFGAWSLVAQSISMTVIDSIVLLAIIPWRPRLQFSLSRGLRMMSFGWKVLAADFSGTFFGQLRSLIIGKAYSSSDLAFYDKGNQIPQLIANNIGNAVSSVLFPAMANESDDVPSVKGMCRRSMKTMSYVISPLMFGLAACAPALIVILYTDKWADCIPYLQVLSIGYAFGTIGIVPIQALKAIGEGGVVLKLEFIKKPVFLLLLFAGVSHSVFAVAMTMLAYELFGFAVNATQLKKYLNYSLGEQLRDIIPNIALSSAMFLSIAFIGISNSLALTLVVQILLGVSVYVIGSIVFKFDSLKFLLSLINRKRG